MGTGGAIANCRAALWRHILRDQRDLITSLRVEEMLEFHRSNGGIGTISLWEVEDPSRFGVADYRKRVEDNEVPRETPIEEAFSNLINAGAYILEPEIFNLMPGSA